MLAALDFKNNLVLLSFESGPLDTDGQRMSVRLFHLAEN